MSGAPAFASNAEPVQSLGVMRSWMALWSALQLQTGRPLPSVADASATVGPVQPKGMRMAKFLPTSGSLAGEASPCAKLEAACVAADTISLRVSGGKGSGTTGAAVSLASAGAAAGTSAVFAAGSF